MLCQPQQIHTQISNDQHSSLRKCEKSERSKSTNIASLMKKRVENWLGGKERAKVSACQIYDQNNQVNKKKVKFNHSTQSVLNQYSIPKMKINGEQTAIAELVNSSEEDQFQELRDKKNPYQRFFENISPRSPVNVVLDLSEESSMKQSLPQIFQSPQSFKQSRMNLNLSNAERQRHSPVNKTNLSTYNQSKGDKTSRLRDQHSNNLQESVDLTINHQLTLIDQDLSMKQNTKTAIMDSDMKHYNIQMSDNANSLKMAANSTNSFIPKNGAESEILKQQNEQFISSNRINRVLNPRHSHHQAYLHPSLRGPQKPSFAAFSNPYSLGQQSIDTPSKKHLHKQTTAIPLNESLYQTPTNNEKIKFHMNDSASQINSSAVELKTKKKSRHFIEVSESVDQFFTPRNDANQKHNFVSEQFHQKNGDTVSFQPLSDTKQKNQSYQKNRIHKSVTKARHKFNMQSSSELMEPASKASQGLLPQLSINTSRLISAERSNSPDKKLQIQFQGNVDKMRQPIQGRRLISIRENITTITSTNKQYTYITPNSKDITSRNGSPLIIQEDLKYTIQAEGNSLLKQGKSTLVSSETTKERVRSILRQVTIKRTLNEETTQLLIGNGSPTELLLSQQILDSFKPKDQQHILNSGNKSVTKRSQRYRRQKTEVNETNATVMDGQKRESQIAQEVKMMEISGKKQEPLIVVRKMTQRQSLMRPLITAALQTPLELNHDKAVLNIQQDRLLAKPRPSHNKVKKTVSTTIGMQTDFDAILPLSSYDDHIPHHQQYSPLKHQQQQQLSDHYQQQYRVILNPEKSPRSKQQYNQTTIEEDIVELCESEDTSSYNCDNDEGEEGSMLEVVQREETPTDKYMYSDIMRRGGAA